MPFRAKGIPAVLQIADKEHESNPYNHSPEDTIPHMNVGYWLEQIKATVAFAADLAGPIEETRTIYRWIRRR